MVRVFLMQAGIKRNIVKALSVAVLGLGLTACASMPDRNDQVAVAQYEQANDPFEPANRAIFGFNQAIDGAVLRPAAEAYRSLLPDEVRGGIRNFINNLGSPLIFANDILQFDLGRASTTFVRFVLNSTIGIAGLMDPATDMGFERHEEDLGQTLGVWGFGEGPFLMAPFLGPMPLRDAIGFGVQTYFNPVNLYLDRIGEDWAMYALFAVDAVDARSRNIETFDEIERTAIDLYATVRTGYRQARNNAIRNGATDPNAGNSAEDFDFDF
ncbi:MAG: MlaA family lipoprotein [Alphaproteobacteria bacterium]